MLERQDDCLEIVWPRQTPCGHESARLIRWSDGGFVKWECSVCDYSWELSDHEFQDLDHVEYCTKCRKPMLKETLAYSNYGYRCDTCGHSVLLGDLLPLARRLSD